MKILVTGPSGQIGWELLRAAHPADELVAADRLRLDFADSEAIRACVRAEKPDLIINAAGYTAVDRAELEPDQARAVNARAVEVLADEARRVGAAILQFSTDYVFDGRKTSPYTPADRPNPLSVYGQTKYEGEQALLSSGASAIILRTSWIYGARGRNFLLAIQRQAELGKPLRVVNDQIGCPTWSRIAAQAAFAILRRALSGQHGRRTFGPYAGIHHVANSGQASWFEFAQAILEERDVPPAQIQPISTAEFGARAVRPAYSVLDCRATTDTFGLTFPHWRESLHAALHEQTIAPEPALADRTGARE